MSISPQNTTNTVLRRTDYLWMQMILVAVVVLSGCEPTTAVATKLDNILTSLESLDRKTKATDSNKWTYVRKIAVDDEIDKQLSYMAENGWELDAIFRQPGRESTAVYEVFWRKRDQP